MHLLGAGDADAEGGARGGQRAGADLLAGDARGVRRLYFACNEAREPLAPKTWIAFKTRYLQHIKGKKPGTEERDRAAISALERVAAGADG